ncbi:MAG: glycosyltransferase family 2 protein, partial [Candidatus Saccharimonadales bacterium]
MTTTFFLQAAFWLSAALVVYAYAGYPLLIFCLGRRRRQPRVVPSSDAELPTVSLVIAAHNEAEVIEDRLRNALALDYPVDKLEIVIASDGSTDGTNKIVRRFADPRVRLLDLSPRHGKAAALNAAVPQVRGELVMFSDANTFWEASAARAIARWFQDPSVGVVCGKLQLVDSRTGNNVDSLYWRYETFLKQCEARLGVLLGANGAIYALRRSLYQPIPEDTIIDDFVIPLSAYLRTGCAMVYDASATAVEETPVQMRSEFGRRARIGAGGFQSIARLRGLLRVRHGWLAVAFVSHKLFRWFAPFALIALVASNLALVGRPEYRILLAGQLLYAALAAVGGYMHGRHPAWRLARAATLFASVNLS